MCRTVHWLRVSALALMAGHFVPVVPAFSSFDLDYVVTGRIWVPALVVEREGLLPTDRVVALADFGDCEEQHAKREQLLEPRERDCRFEHQLGDALASSGIFRRVDRTPRPGVAVDLILSPRRSRVQFRRQVIPAAKPFAVLSFLTYLWTPLPFETDVESYDLRVAILDPTGKLMAEAAVSREFTHSLNAYSVERTAPEGLLVRMEASERELGPIIVCRGPHAGVAVREILQNLSAAVSSIGTTPRPAEARRRWGAPGEFTSG